MKKTYFSGIQPTAQAPHLGNYLGAFKQWVEMQSEYAPYYCVVDLHAISVPQAPQRLNDSIYATYAILLAVGIDPNLSTLFVQSHNPLHTELAWLLNCHTHLGELKRMTQFKEKSLKQQQIVSVGLYDYPVLMAADILLYDSEVVPVGEDQIQHVELTRDIAKRFNSQYGEVFTLPKAKIVKEQARIMSLQDPSKKMSKSDVNQSATLFLLDDQDTLVKKIQSAVTDSERTIVFDPRRPGLYNLLTIYKALSNQFETEIEAHFQGKGYKELKQELSERVIALFMPFQARFKELIKDRGELKKLMKQNAEKAVVVAERKVKLVKEKIGFIL